MSDNKVINIRPVGLDDAEAIASIYKPFVEDTVISFELDPPDGKEMRRRMEELVPKYPWLVAELGEVVVGYAYGRPYHNRPAYRWTVETGIYCARSAHGQGLGHKLYEALLEELKQRGFFVAVGVMAEGNPASTALHERLDFRKVGTVRGVGFKSGAWHDVTTWQKDLSTRPKQPAEPLDG